MTMTSRLKEVISYSGKSLRGFAQQCGISQPTLDKQIKGVRGVSLETVMSVLSAYPEISAEWLLREQGEMFLLSPEAREVDSIKKFTNVIGTVQEIIELKNERIQQLEERIKQLEKHINTKSL